MLFLLNVDVVPLNTAGKKPSISPIFGFKVLNLTDEAFLVQDKTKSTVIVFLAPVRLAPW